jgi:hypothetical protein
MTATDWKQHHANEAEKAVYHPMVQHVIEEFARNMKISLDGLPRYGQKIATYAAQVARAQTLGIDPELLRLTADEYNSEALRLAAEATFRGIPTYVIETEQP